MEIIKNDNLKIHAKLRKLGDMCDVLVKKAAAFNYTYVKEEDVLAKVKAGLKRYGVNLYHEIVPNTLHVTPFTYQKIDKKTKELKPVQEYLVQADTVNTFVDIESGESLQFPWALVASMEDPSLSLGSALSYTNRYFLLKFFQIPTVEADPDAYRSKQAEAELYEEKERERIEKKELEEGKKNIADVVNKFIAEGGSREDAIAIISKRNGGIGNPNTIKSIEIVNAILRDFEAKNSK